MQKSIIANFLLILFVSMQAMYFCGGMQLLRHKHSEKTRTKKNIYLTFSADDWSDVEKMNEDEVRIKGKMFDVKSVHTEHDQVIVYGHFDHDEDEMLEYAKETNKKKSEQKKHPASDNTLFFEEATTVSTLAFPVLLKKDFPLLSQMYHFQYYKIENPPPRIMA